MPIAEQKQTKFHPTSRNKVLASADVNIQQVQLVDKRGQVRSVVVWQCGSDVFYANTMDGMFDTAQRKTAPPWLKEALQDLDLNNQFNYDGTSKAGNNTKAPASKPYLPTDGEGPDFIQED